MTAHVETLSRRSGGQKLPSTPDTTPKTAICSSFLNQVLLHDWWLIKAYSDSDGKRLGVGGFSLKEGQGIRSFSSAPIVMRRDAVTVKTADGITIMVQGFINKARTLENGFSNEVCDDFLIGFPYYWEEFAALSVGEEPNSASKGVSCSDASKDPPPGDHRTNKLSRNIFDTTPNEASNAKKESSLPIQSAVPVNKKKRRAERDRKDSSNVEHLKHSGPFTRSRARLLDN